MPNSSSCYNHAESFKLLPHSIGRTEVKLNKAHVVLPIIENVLKFAEESVLQSDLSSAINLQSLNEISTRVASRTQIQGTDVTKLVNILQDVKEQQLQTPWLWFTCVVVISVVIGSLWLIWHRLAKHYSSEISRTRCNNCVFILRNGFTLHVSGDNFTHHQEYICCIWPQVSRLT